MKKKLLQKHRGILLALFSFLCVISINAQTITNPSFEAGDFTGWTWTGNTGYGWVGVNDNAPNATQGTHIAGTWNGTFGDVQLSQTIINLQNGMYTVTADLMGSSNGAGSRLTTQRLFANWKCMLFGPSSAYSTENLAIIGAPAVQYSFGGYAETQSDDSPLRTLTVTTAVTDGTLTLGIRTNGKSSSLGYTFPLLINGGDDGKGWFKVDNFTMTYVGAIPTDAATQAEKDALQVQIDAATALLASTTQGTAAGQYTTANRTVLNDANASATTVLHENAIQEYVNSTTCSLASAMLTYQNSRNIVTVTDDAANQDRLVSGLYLIRLKGTNLYLTAPTAIGDADVNRVTYQTLLDANVQNCQRWNIQFNRNSEFADPARYSFVSAIYGTIDWTEESGTTVVGHLGENGRFREKNTALTQTGLEGIHHNFTVSYDGTAFGLYAVGSNLALNISAVSGTTTYGRSNPVQYLYEFIVAPNHATVVNQAEMNIIGGTLTIDQDITVHNLTINPAAKVTLSSGKTLTVTGNLAINSDATGTGTFVDANAAGALTVSGTTTVQQYLTSGRNWYVSSPVTSATSNVFSAASSETNKLYSYNEVTNEWPVITNNSTALTVGNGYVANIPTGNVTFTGTLNTGDVTPINISSTAANTSYQGYNLVGNPYPSYLNWDLVPAASTSVKTSIWQRSQNGSSAYVFDTYNSSGQVAIDNSGKGTNGDIAPMQAFWVQVTDGQSSGSVTFTNAMRSHKGSKAIEGGTVTDPIFKAKSSVSTTQSLLRLQVSNGVNSDEAVIYSNSGASNSYDNYDSQKMSNNNVAIPEIYTIAGSHKLAIDGLNSIPVNTELPLGFTTGQSNSFTIKATEFSNFDANTKVYLKDKLSVTEYDLTDGTAYTFASDITSTTDRFSVIFKSASLATGLESNNLPVNIFRNANGLITINRNATIGQEGMVTVCNAVGQKLVNTPTTGSSTVINKSLTSGVYFVTLNVAGKNTTKKVIIN